MRLLSILLFLIFSVHSKGQQVKNSKWIIGPSIGYHHQEKSFFKASLWGLTDLGYANYLRFDAGANMTFADKKAHFIPELSVTYYLSAKGVWPLIKAEVTPYTLTPKLGFGIFNIVEFAAGYGFELKQKSNFPPIKGFNFSVGINIPFNYHLH